MSQEPFDIYDNLPKMLNASQISEVMGISKSFTYNLFHREDFPAIHIGSRYIVPRDHFLEWLRKQSTPNGFFASEE